MWQLGLQSTEEWEEADGHGVAAALYEGWWGRGVTGVMGGTCTGGRTHGFSQGHILVPEHRLGDSPVAVCDLRLCLVSA